MANLRDGKFKIRLNKAAYLLLDGEARERIRAIRAGRERRIG
jgi:hypothetical protein